MQFNIEYENEIDFAHCENIRYAMEKQSILTNIINRILTVRHMAKKEILEECSKFTGEQMHKLSWDNKLCRLEELTKSAELVNLWLDADIAYRKVRFKQSQVIEDLRALKKIVEVTPR